MKKKLISCLCAFALVATMFPASAFASDVDSWYCRGCGKTVTSIEGLRLHNCSEPEWKCPDCGNYEYGEPLDWYDHKCEFWCVDCNGDFYDYNEYKSHFCKECPNCYMNFTDEEKYNNHFCQYCTNCYDIFTDKEEYKTHTNYECKYFCYDCDQYFKGQIEYKSHNCSGYTDWECPKCNAVNSISSEYENATCSFCNRDFDKCPNCNSWCWMDSVDYIDGLCYSCGHDFYNQDVRVNLRNQIYAYGQSNRIVIDYTCGVNYIELYLINPNGSHIKVTSFNPNNCSNYYYGGGNGNYDDSIQYWDYNRKRDTKYRYYVKYYLKNSAGIVAKSGTTATKTYWTAPQAKASNVKKNGTKVTWNKVAGADGYRVTFKRYKNIGYHQWQLNSRNQWTTKNKAYRKLDPSPFYKYERVNSVRTYAKHGNKYYSHGCKVRTVKTNLFV